MTISDTLTQLGGEDFLSELTEFMLNRIMEADVTQPIKAERHERSNERETYRNGYRDPQYNTRLGTLDLRIPKLREGSYFPSFLDARRLSEKALNAVIQEAWINGVSTRKVDALVQSMGMTGITRSQVSSICRGIDERVQAFLHRPLEGEWPYLWLDATYVKVRRNSRVVSEAVIIACAVNLDGRRAIISTGIGGSEAKSFWLAFLLSIKERELEGSEAGHIRLTQWSEVSDTAGVLCQLAAMTGPLHAQRAEPRHQGQPVGGAGTIAAGVRVDRREMRTCHRSGSCRSTGVEQSGSHGDDGRS